MIIDYLSYRHVNSSISIYSTENVEPRSDAFLVDSIGLAPKSPLLSSEFCIDKEALINIDQYSISIQ